MISLPHGRYYTKVDDLHYLWEKAGTYYLRLYKGDEATGITIVIYASTSDRSPRCLSSRTGSIMRSRRSHRRLGHGEFLVPLQIVLAHCSFRLPNCRFGVIHDSLIGYCSFGYQSSKITFQCLWRCRCESYLYIGESCCAPRLFHVSCNAKGR